MMESITFYWNNQVHSSSTSSDQDQSFSSSSPHATPTYYKALLPISPSSSLMIVRTSSSYSTDESDQGFNILGPSTQTSPKSAASQFTQSQHPEKTQTKSQLVNRGAFQSKVLSREHAEFTVLMGEDGRMKLSITDLNSSHGSYISRRNAALPTPVGSNKFRFETGNPHVDGEGDGEDLEKCIPGQAVELKNGDFIQLGRDVGKDGMWHGAIRGYIFCEEETRSTSPINSAPLFSGIKKPLTPPEEEDSYGPSFRQFLGRKPTLYQEVSSSTGFHSESASEIGSGTDVPLCSAAIEEAYSESEEGNLEEDSREEGYSDSDEPGVKQMEEEEEEEALPLAVLSSKGFAFSYEEEADIRRVEKGIHPELEDDSEDLEDTWREDRDLVASSSNGRFSQLSPYDLHLQPFKAKTVDHFFEDRRVDGRASSSLQRDPQSTRGNRYGLDSDMDDSDSNVSGDQEPHLEVQGEQDEHHEIKERDSSPNGRLFGTRGFGRASESGVEIKRESSNSRDFENYANSRDFENYDHQGGEVNQEEKGTSNESAQSIGGRAQRIEDFESSSEGASSPQQFGIKDAATIGAEVKTNTQACPVPKGYPVPQQNNRSSLSPVVTSSPHAPARVLPSIQKSTNVSKLSPYGDVARSHVLTSIPRGSAMACTSTFTSTSSVNLNKRSNLFNPLRNKSSKRKMLRKMILQPREGRSGKSVRTGLQIKGTASRVRKEKKDDQLDPDSHAESTPRGKVAVVSPSPSPPPGAAEEDQSLTVNSESQGPSQPEAEAEAEDVQVNYDTMDLSGSEPMEPISAQRNTVGFTFKEAESRQEEAEKEVDASAPIVQSSNGFEFADEEFLDQTDEFMDGAPDNWEDRGEYEEDAPQEDDWDGMGENGESQGTPDSDASSAKTGFESPSNLGALYPAMRINRPSRPNVQSSNAAASSQAVRKSLARVSGRNVSMSQVDDAIQKTIQNLEATRPSKEIETSTGLKRSCEAALGSSIITSAKRQRSEVSPPTDSIRARRGYLHGIAVGVGYTLGVASVAFGFICALASIETPPSMI